MAASATSFNSIADRIKPFGSDVLSKPMAFGWDDAILGGGTALSGLFGAIGANKQANTQAAIANAQMAAQADAIRQSREMAKGQMGMGMFNTLFGSTTGADIDYARQLAGKRTEYAELFPKEFGLNREQSRWQAAFETSPDVLEASRKQRMGRIQESIAPSLAGQTAFFGPIRRINMESLVG